MSTLIITGARGFLGQAISAEVARADGYPVQTDRRPSENVLGLDITDPSQLDQLFATHSGAAAVLHLAAAGSGQDGLVAGADTDPVAAVRTNVEGFVHVVEAAARHNIPRVIWSSSTTVYGSAADYDRPEVTEAAPFKPTTLYGSTKVACEHIGPLLAAKHDIDVVSLRLPMVYGPGRWYGGSQEALMHVTRAAEQAYAPEVRCWSTPTDWIHVEDAATAMLALAEARTVAPSYHAVGHRGSLLELARHITEALGVSTTGISEQHTGGPDLPLTDDSALRTRHGWSPRYATAAQGAATYRRRTTVPSA